jgi:small subunit ribosomal protein S23
MEDKIRRQFFADFPFEAFRPTSLIEMTRSGEPDPTIPEGEEWQTLEQRGAYPTVEE